MVCILPYMEKAHAVLPYMEKAHAAVCDPSIGNVHRRPKFIVSPLQNPITFKTFLPFYS